MANRFNIWKLINKVTGNIKEKNHIINSIDAEKSLSEIQYLFMTKSSVGVEDMSSIW